MSPLLSLATRLLRLNPHWPQERVYQETRKLQGALLQVLTFNELLPELLGGKAELLGEYAGFRPSVDPAVSVEFSAAAARMHGSMQVGQPKRSRSTRSRSSEKFS